ncbi:MAG: 2-succinyl-5-enolpyruvyl-6-hydroxy-3-cyclohexene-1-carboxylic-acid synthase [Melioribacteraceae bacterium]|nr:MAG: 2-succinyl-5-enolpyruvyl-6-hydroxy-3-cyclohexene-1-carboxylic-acid synthase [Melioribacteraceae bacterium]
MSHNLNYIWSKFIVDQFVQFGVKHVCISPGSRNTPLTTAFAENKRIKKYVNIDERSSAFFALGIAKAVNQPVALLTTSGTATANLYPAIIEAYLQRIPLIICTADRPAQLRNTGANQTINQNNLYGNHIRLFKDIALPNIKLSAFISIHKNISKAFEIALHENCGPVHFNFQFDKPLEKSTYDCVIPSELLKSISELSTSFTVDTRKYSAKNKILKDVVSKINRSGKGLILVGWDNYSKDFIKEIIKLSDKTGYPILCDGASGIFLKSNHKNLIVNHPAFLRSSKFVEKYSPKVVIQFGNAPTSNAMLDFLKNLKSYKVAVNSFGDRKDSGVNFAYTITSDPILFCSEIYKKIDQNKSRTYLNSIIEIDNRIEKMKNSFLRATKVYEEVNILEQVFESLPKYSNVFVSNSLPIRDLEFFKSKSNKNINLFVNRGASGIDGITSTAAGISVASKRPTVLITGDLSFFHDTNGLHIIKKYKIPLTIILINNGGGAIFGMLPVVKEKSIFDEYFFTPLNLEFSQLAKTYQAKYYSIKSFDSLTKKLKVSLTNRDFSLLEIKTDYRKAIELRKKYFRDVIQLVEKDL